MIWIDIDGHRLGLTFSHPTIGTGKKAHRRTICELYQEVSDTDLELIATNYIDCSVQDTFRRSVGRKNSLARTLCQHEYNIGSAYPALKCKKCGSPRAATFPLTKDARTKIWLSYFDAIAPKVQINDSNSTETEVQKS